MQYKYVYTFKNDELSYLFQNISDTKEGKIVTHTYT